MAPDDDVTAVCIERPIFGIDFLSLVPPRHSVTQQIGDDGMTNEGVGVGGQYVG